ncbi:MAG: hypothetical protein AB7G93_05415 [Bdellovibrionales bacterium]
MDLRRARGPTYKMAPNAPPVAGPMGVGIGTHLANLMGGRKEEKMERTKFSRNPNANSTRKEGIVQRIGDAIERVGEKLSRSGARRLGRKVYKVGDRVEHSQDNPNDLKH